MSADTAIGGDRTAAARNSRTSPTALQISEIRQQQRP